MNGLINSPLFGVTATCLVYYLALSLYRRRPFFLFNPVLLSVTALILLLKGFNIDHAAYDKGGQIISFFLGPAVVALGLPLYERLSEIRERKAATLVSIMVGALVGIVSAAGIALLMGAPKEIIASLAPKSVTTPIAMGVSEKLGGIPSLTAALVIATGILGAVFGPVFLKWIGVKSPTAFGLAMGTASHGIGTARAMEAGKTQGAASALAIGLCGAATAVLAPIVFWIMM